MVDILVSGNDAPTASSASLEACALGDAVLHGVGVYLREILGQGRSGVIDVAEASELVARVLDSEDGVVGGRAIKRNSGAR